MAKEHTREGRFRREGGGFAVAGIVAAYFASPFVSRADPEWLLLSGSCFALGIVGIYTSMVLGEKSRAKTIWTAFLLFSGIAGLGYAAVDATYEHRALARHCAALQNEILNGRAPGTATPPPGRSDAADAFQALGCRARWYEPWLEPHA
jgi:hypothetical protein